MSLVLPVSRSWCPSLHPALLNDPTGRDGHLAAVGRQHHGQRRPGVLVAEHIPGDVHLRAALLAGVAASVHRQPAREGMLAAAARHQVAMRLSGFPVDRQQHAHRAAGPDAGQCVLDEPRGQPRGGLYGGLVMT